MKKDFLTNLFKSLKKTTKQKESEEGLNRTELNEKNDNGKPDVVEYHETLYSDRSNQLTRSSFDKKLMFTNVKSVESDIDDINKGKPAERGNIEKKVDVLLSKKKEKKKQITLPPKKQANMVYVVSKPQPGQVKGDWAVRSHYKIFSHHRTKQAAINKAREIALQREASVLVQNTDGKFSDGFKPRKKKK